jgi:hypothetical protein
MKYAGVNRRNNSAATLPIMERLVVFFFFVSSVGPKNHSDGNMTEAPSAPSDVRLPVLLLSGESS